MCDRIILMFVLVLGALAWGQQSDAGQATPSDQPNMPGMEMPAHDGGPAGPEAASMHAMEGHMGMGPHMKMTALRPAQPGDAERARQVLEVARKVSSKYIDYHAALADGFTIFHPEVAQKMYHFNNYQYAMEARETFNPDHPTSLLYEKHGDGYKLIGIMYTAPRSFSEDQLNERIPLSIAQWHEHVNYCAAPGGHKDAMLASHSQFGLMGSISTREACDAAGGTFHPVVFGWMVHLYPFEKDQASIWSVDRQLGDD